MLQRLQDKLCYVRLPGMYQHATSSITFKVSSSAYCCCWSALPRSVLVTIVSTIFSILHCSNPEQHKIAQKTSEIPRRTAPLQNHSDLSKKVKSSITIMLVRERQAMPFATLTFLCNIFNPWFLCWSAFHHMLIAVRLSFILNISSRNSFGTTLKYYRHAEVFQRRCAHWLWALWLASWQTLSQSSAENYSASCQPALQEN